VEVDLKNQTVTDLKVENDEGSAFSKVAYDQGKLFIFGGQNSAGSCFAFDLEKRTLT